MTTDVTAIAAKVEEFKANPKNQALIEGKSSVQEIVSVMVQCGQLNMEEALDYQNSLFGDKQFLGANDVFQAQSNSVQSFQNRFDENSPMHKIVEGMNAVQEKYAGMSEDEQVLASMELQKNIQKAFKELEKNESIPKEWLDNLKNDFKDVNNIKSFLKAVFNRIDKGSDAIDSITWDLVKPSGENIENDFLRGAYGFVDDLFSTKGVMSMLTIALGLGIGSEVAIAKGVTEATVKTVLQAGFTGLGIGQTGMGIYGAATADTPEEMEQAGYETAAGTFVATTAMAAPKIAKGMSKIGSAISKGASKVKATVKGEVEKVEGKIEKAKTERAAKAKLDITDRAAVLKASPDKIMKPNKADNVGGSGIKFKQVPEYNKDGTIKNYTATKIKFGKTVEETLELNKAQGINLELVPDPTTGELHFGIRDVWSDNHYHRVDRSSVVMKYGEYSPEDCGVKDVDWISQNKTPDGNISDCAVVANSSDARIFDKGYVDANGNPVDFASLDGPIEVHKSPDATVNVVGFDEPRIVQELEGANPEPRDFAMGDVDGNAYNDFNNFKKQVLKGKVVADETDPLSQKCIDLIKESKDDAAKALIKNATKSPEPEIVDEVIGDKVYRTTIERDRLGRITKKTSMGGNRVEEFNPETGLKTSEHEFHELYTRDDDLVATRDIKYDSQGREVERTVSGDGRYFFNEPAGTTKTVYNETTGNISSKTRTTTEGDIHKTVYVKGKLLYTIEERTPNKWDNRYGWQDAPKRVGTKKAPDGTVLENYEVYNNYIQTTNLKTGAVTYSSETLGGKYTATEVDGTTTVHIEDSYGQKYDYTVKKGMSYKERTAKMDQVKAKVEDSIAQKQATESRTVDEDLGYTQIDYTDNKGNVIKRVFYETDRPNNAQCEYFDYDAQGRTTCEIKNNEAKFNQYEGTSTRASAYDDNSGFWQYDKGIGRYVKVDNALVLGLDGSTFNMKFGLGGLWQVLIH